MRKAIIELEDSPGLILSDIVGWVDRSWNVDAVPHEDLRAEQIFIDLASGRRDDRASFLEVLRQIDSGEITTLIVRQDRFSRDVRKTHEISDLLERSGCRLFELLRWRYVNFNDPEDWADFQGRGVSAEKESRVISRRIRDNKEFSKAQGKLLGKPAFGFKRSTAGTPEPNPEQWETARLIVQSFFECQRSSVLTARWIREELGVCWTHQGLHGWLLNPTLRGHTHYGTRGNAKREILYNTHTPLLTPEEIRQIDLALVECKKQRSGVLNYHLYPLANFLYCDRCGSRCRINRTTDSKYGYCYTNVYCSEHQAGSGCGGLIQRMGKAYGTKPNGRYNRLGTPYADTEKAVIEALRLKARKLAQGMQPERVLPESAEVVRLRQQIQQYEQLAAADADMESILNKKRQQLKLLLAEASQGNHPALESKRSLLIEIAESPERWALFWQQSTPEKRLVLFSDFVERVGCDRDSISVSLKI